jgi:hypothetical protein
LLLMDALCSTFAFQEYVVLSHRIEIQLQARRAKLCPTEV